MRRSRVELESSLEARDNHLERERYLRARSQEAQKAERDWNRELQAEVMRMHRELGALGDPGDVPNMVLRLAKRLLGAEKGMLLSREDEDSDGKLDLITAEGFEHDPGKSAIVQRFAEEVVEQDQIIREDEPQEVGDSGIAADEEIENLVAIPMILFALDRTGEFTLSEGKGLRALGLKPGEIVGCSVFDVYRDEPEVTGLVHRVLEGEEVSTALEVGGRALGVWCGPVRDEDGEVVGLIGLAADIGEEERAGGEKAVSVRRAGLRADTSANLAAGGVLQRARDLAAAQGVPVPVPGSALRHARPYD